MATPDFRHRARLHVRAAKELLATDGEDAAQFACLKLRMAIEALSYQMLQTYRAEVPYSAMLKWPPKKVIDELLEIDDTADKSRTIAIGIEETPGVPAPKMDFLGEDKRFSARWANKAHNALGSFLHEPTLGQHEKGVGFDEDAARAKAAEIATSLEDILNTPLISVNIGQFMELDCDCGFKIKRKLAVLEAGKRFTCGGCGKHFLYALNPAGDGYNFVPDGMAYNCLACGVEQLVPAHQVEQLPVLACTDCGAKVQVEAAYTLRSVQP